MPIAALMTVGEADHGATILGVPIIEFQLRRAVAAGARHVVLLVERVPTVVLATADRLRRSGIGVDIARTIGDAIDFVHPEDRVLLVGSSVHAEDGDLASLVESSDPALLVLPADIAPPQAEIIDMHTRWTGWARLDGALLRRIGAIVGDWDLASTILRQLRQDGAVLIHGTAPAVIANLARREGRKCLADALVARGEPPRAAIGMRLLGNPVAGQLARRASDNGLTGATVETAALAIAAVALSAALIGQIVLPAMLMLFAQPLAAAAARIEAALGFKRRWASMRTHVIAAAGAVVLLSIGVTLTRSTGQWGCALLAMTIIMTQALLDSGDGVASVHHFRGDALAIFTLVLVGALLGVPVLTLGMILAWQWSAVALWRWRHGSPQA